MYLLPYANSGVAVAQNIQDFEFVFIGAAVETDGTIFALNAAQQAAANSVFLACGKGDLSDALFDTVKAAALATPPNYNENNVPQPVPSPAELANIKTGLVNYFDEIEAIADAADCIGFCVKGLPIRQVVSVELIVKDVSAMANVVIAKAGPALLIPEPVTLGSSSEIIKTGSTEIDFDTDPLNIMVKNQIVFGSLNVVTAASFVPTTGDQLILRIKGVL